MTPQVHLTLPEEILLLALRNEEGTTRLESTYPYAIGGAVLAELLINKRIRLDSTKSRSVQLVNTRSLGDPLLDDCLTRVPRAKRPAAAQTWVSKFAGTKKLKLRLALQLCDKGILRADEDKVLALFSRKIYPEIDPGPERAMVERLRRAIFSDTERLDSRTVVLVSLAKSAGLLEGIFDKRDLRDRKARIEQIINGDDLGRATKEAIKAVQAAVLVACALPAITSTTITR